jgi:hypothetical protein
MTKISLVVLRMRGIDRAAQHAQFGQQLARGAGLAWRQRQVVGAQRVGRHLVAAGARIASCLVLHFQQQEVVAARPRQLPRRRQAANPAAGDGHGGPACFGRRRKVRLPQAVAERLVGA